MSLWGDKLRPNYVLPCIYSDCQRVPFWKEFGKLCRVQSPQACPQFRYQLQAGRSVRLLSLQTNQHKFRGPHKHFDDLMTHQRDQNSLIPFTLTVASGYKLEPTERIQIRTSRRKRYIWLSLRGFQMEYRQSGSHLSLWYPEFLLGLHHALPV